MKNVLFFILATFSSIFSVQTVEAFKGCENKRMNEICLSPEVDRCYTCLNVEQSKFIHPPVCVPIFHEHLGALDNYPANNWNCTLFSPQVNKNEELIKDICKIDEFISVICKDQDKNGFCLIANYIGDICDKAEEEYNLDSLEDSKHVITQGAFYPACSGAICQKEGWTWQKTAYGKDWCGSGTCIPFGKSTFVCSYPNKCGKKTTSLDTLHRDIDSELLENEFHVMGCGKEKFKCILNKECRNLVKSLKECDEEFGCIYQIVSTNSNDMFIKLANCMYHN
jgi:hypothetical protein